MKDVNEIKERIITEKMLATELMDEYFKNRLEFVKDEDSGYLRMYGKVQERINILEWIIEEDLKKVK